MASLDYGWMERWMALFQLHMHTCAYTHGHTHTHVKPQKEQQRNLGFISSSAIESWTCVSSSVKGMVGPATF